MGKMFRFFRCFALFLAIFMVGNAVAATRNVITFSTTLGTWTGPSSLGVVAGSANEGQPTLPDLSAYPIPTRSGYEFVGWYGEGKKYYSGNNTPVRLWDRTTGITLMPGWRQLSGFTCKVSRYNYTSCNSGYYLSGCGAASTWPKTLTAIQVSSGTNTCLSCPDYYTCAGGTTCPTPGQYSVSFQLNGGTGTTPTSQTYYKGKTYTLPTATNFYRTGYTFNGWAVSMNATSGSTTYSDPVNSNTGAVTLYAVWQRSSTGPRIITLDVNEPSGADVNVPVPDVLYKNAGYPTWYNDILAVNVVERLTTVPSDKNNKYRFDGFYRIDYTDIQCIDSYGYVDNSANCDFSSDVTLQARWTPKYSVTYSCGTGGGTAPLTGTAYAGESYVTANPGNCSKAGFNFDGWLISGTSSKYAAGYSFTWNYTENKTLTAQWTAASYTLTFNKNGGTGGTDSTTAVYNAAVAPITPPTRAGYTFNGYYTATSGGTQYFGPNGAFVPDHYTNAGNLTLYAQWTAACTPIEFENGETQVTLKTLYQKGSATTWYSDAACTTAVTTVAFPDVVNTASTMLRYDDTDVSCSDPSTGCTLPAQSLVGAPTVNVKWSCKTGYSKNSPGYCYANSIYITYNANGATSGSAPSQQTCTYDGTCTAATQGNLLKTNSIFLGWAETANATTAKYAAGASIKNIVTSGTKILYAVWSTCSACQGNAGVDCSLSVVNNTCTYTTTCQAGYYGMVSSGRYDAQCGKCEAGYACPGGNPGARNPCSGTLQYQNETGQSTCKTVSAGYYKSSNSAQSQCPANYRSGAAATSQSGCTTSCAAGTRVVTANAACTTPSGGWYTAAHTVNYGQVSTVNYCSNGFSNTSTTASGHDAVTDCTITVPAGSYIPSNTVKARYIYVSTAGSTANGGSHVSEIQAFASNNGTGTNLLSGKGGISGSNMTAATDGSWSRGNYASGTMIWDLGSIQEIGSIKFALYTDGRVYSDVRIALAEVEGEYTVVLGPVDIATRNVATATPEMLVVATSTATTCDAGTYLSGSRTFSLTQAAQSPSVCTVCATDTYSDAGASSCTSCASGYRNSGSSAADHANVTSCRTEITLNKNGGSGAVTGSSSGTSVGYIYCEQGQACNFGSTSGLSQTGYTFKGGWGASTSCTATTTSFKNPVGTYYACKTAKTSSVTFDENGGEWPTAGAPQAVAPTFGKSMPALSTTTPPTRAGYVFMGWYDSKDYTAGTQYYTVAGASARNWDKDVTTTTLYAGWKLNVRTITLNANGGTNGTPSPLYYVSWGGGHSWYSDAAGTNEIESLTGFPTRSGYVFTGYNTSSGWPCVLADGSLSQDSSCAFSGDVTLTAQWTAPTCTAGTGVSSVTASVGSPNVVSCTVTCKSGYSMSGGEYENTTFTKSATTSGTTSMTVSCLPRTYKVTYSCGDGSGTPPANATATFDANFTPAANTCTKAGYAFNGWMVSDTSDVRPAGTAFKWGYTADKTFTPKWTANTYTISFDVNGGSGGQSENVTATYDSNMPTISTTKPTKTGYTFNGWWDTSATTGGTQYYTAAGASARTWNKTANTKLYARWVANTITIKYNVNGGTGTTPAQHTCSYNGTCTAAAQGTMLRSGYVFMGWQNGSGDWDNSTTLILPGASIKNIATGGTVTLYAMWSAPVCKSGNSATTVGSTGTLTITNNVPSCTVTCKTGYSKNGGTDTTNTVTVTGTAGKAELGSPSCNVRLFTVTFSNNGHTNVANVPNFSLVVPYGSRLPDLDGEDDIPVRQGYRFAGWFDKVTFQQFYDMGGVVRHAIGVQSNLTLIPGWYTLGGFSCKLERFYDSCAPGKYLSTCATQGEIDGALANYCLTCPQGSYCPGATRCPVKIYTTTLDKNTTDTSATASEPTSLYQRAGQTTWYSDAKTATTVSTLTTVPTRTGYKFEGYYTTSAASGGTQCIDSNGTLSTASACAATGNRTLYARWTAKCNAIRLNNVFNGGSGGTTAVYKKTDSTTWYSDMTCTTTITTVTKPTKTNATYAGTYATSGNSGGTQCIDSSGTLSTDAACNVKAANVLYARYDCNNGWKEAGTTISGTCIGTMTVSASDKTLTYTGSAQSCANVTVTVPSSGATVMYSTASNGTFSETAPALTNVGKQTVYYQVTATDYATKTGSYTCTMNKAANPITISSASGSTTYGTNKTFTVSGAQGTLSVESSNESVATVSVSGTTVTMVPVKPSTSSITITVTAAGNSNYNSGSKTYTLTVNKAANPITLASASGSTNFPSNKTVSVSGAQGTLSVESSNESVATVSVSGTTVTMTPKKVGSATITVTAAGNDYYNSGSKTYALTVSNGTITATANDKSMNYTGSAQSCANVTNVVPSGATVTYSTSESGTYSATAPTQTNAGSQTVYYKITATNYNNKTGSYKCTVNAIAGTMTQSATSGTIYYPNNGTFTVSNVKGTVTVSSSDTSVATVSYNNGTITMTPKKVGSATITVKDDGGVNYNDKSLTYALTVVNSTFTVKFNTTGAASGTTSGAPSVNSVNCTYDSACTAATRNTLYNTERVFLGWSKTSGATTATYSAGGSIKNIASANGATVNLYPVFEKPSGCTKGTGVSTATVSVNSSNTPVCAVTCSTGYSKDGGTTTTTSFNVNGTANSTAAVATACAIRKATCSAGYYMAKSAVVCTAVCPAGKYCSGGSTYSYSTSADQGITGNVSGGYYSTNGGTSATPTEAGTGCLADYECGKVANGYYSGGGGTSAAGTCVSGQTCGQCPTANSSTQRTTFPDEYYPWDSVTKAYVKTTTPTVASIRNQSWGTGWKSINECRAVYSITNAAATFSVEAVGYNSSTSKYDSGGSMYYARVNGGYYLDTIYSSTYCNTSTNSMLYKRAVVCPANSYCAGGSVPKCSSGTYNSEWGKSSCPVNYGNSAAGSDAETDCYLKTSSTKFVKTAKVAEETCTAGGYCPGNVTVYYNSTGGRTACAAGTANANTGSSAASACVTCVAGSYNTTTGNSTCSTCPANSYCTGGTHNATCASGTSSKYTLSSAGSNSVSDCYLTTTKTNYVAEESKGLVQCVANGWCPGGATVYYNDTEGTRDVTGGRTACSTLAGGLYPNSDAGSDANTDCRTASMSGKTVTTANASTTTNCSAGTYKGAHTVNYGSKSSCTVCGDNQWSNASAASCSACDTAKGYVNSGDAASAHAGDASCKVTCAAGTRVTTANAACTSPAGAWFTTASQTIPYGQVSVVNYCAAGFTSSSTAASGHDAATDCSISVGGGKYIAANTVQARYIRFTSDGSDKSAYTNIVEVQAFENNAATGTNLLNTSSGIAGTNAAKGVDGDWTNSSHAYGTTSSPVIFDMGAAKSLGAIKFGVYSDGRTYENFTVAVSTDKTTWTTVMEPTTIATQTVTTVSPHVLVVAPSEQKSCAAGTSKAARTRYLTTAADTCGTCDNWTYSSDGAASCTNCLAATSGWTKASGSGWTSYKQCVQTLAAPTANNCYGGSFSNTQSSANAWAGVVRNTATADKGYYVNVASLTCSKCAAGYYNATDGSDKTTNTCEGTIAAGYWGAAGATSSTGSGTVDGGYYSTGGGTSATPTENGNGCVGSGKTCGKLSAGYYSNGGSTINGATCVSGKTCGACPTNYDDNTTTGKTARTQCQLKCNGGSYVKDADGACVGLSNVAQYVAANTVNAGSTSSAQIKNCPAAEENWTLGKGSNWDAYNDCFETRAATNVSTYCSTGQLKKNASSATAWPTSASISTAFKAKAGAYVKGQTCEPVAAGRYSSADNTLTTDQGAGAVSAGYYCGGGAATATPTATSNSINGKACGKCSALAGGIYPNSDAGSSAETDCKTDSISGKVVADANASTFTTCTAGYFKGAHVVNYGGTSACEACTGAKYSESDGAAACTTCPTATNSTNVTGYSYWNGGKTGDHTVREGCYATFKASDIDNGSTTAYHCYIDKDNNAYGLAATGKICWINVSNLKCDEKYYNAAANNGGTQTSAATITALFANTCASAGTGYWSAADVLTRTQCPAGYREGAAASAESGCAVITDLGNYVASTGSGVTACTTGNYCEGGTTVYYGGSTSTTGGIKSCSENTSSKYTQSAASSDNVGDCYLNTSAGSYVKTASAGQENCPANSYCVGGTKVFYNTAGGATVTGGSATCASGTSSKYTLSSAGANTVSDCYLKTEAGKYVKTESAGQVTCTGGFCAGNTTVYYNDTESARVVTGGLSSCPSPYTKIADGKSSNAYCYLTTTATNYVAEATKGQVTCLAGGKCAGGTNVYYGTAGGATTGGREQCTGATWAGTGASACETCPSIYVSDTTAGKTAQNQCKVTTGNGYYIANANDDTKTQCEANYYCPSSTVAYGSTGTRNACPVAADHKRATIPAEYYATTFSTSLSNSKGRWDISQCRVINSYNGTRGKLYDYLTYNTDSKKYDVQGSVLWYEAKAGYYLGGNKTGCGTYAYYGSAFQCENGYYCPGKAATQCNSSNQSTVQVDYYGRETCPTNYGNSAAGSDAETDCYLKTSSTKFVKTAKAAEETCTAGGYCPGNVTVYYNSTGGRTACATGSYTDKAGQTACVACQNGSTTTAAGQTSCNKTCDNNNGNVKSWTTATWAANSVTNACKVSACQACAATNANCSITAASTNACTATTTCKGGYYNIQNDGKYNASCGDVGVGYWSADKSNTRTQCTSPMTTIGYGAGADEAADCGRILNAGTNKIYLRSGKKTTPSLNVKIGDTTFYGNMGTSSRSGLKLKSGDTTYTVYDDANPL